MLAGVLVGVVLCCPWSGLVWVLVVFLLLVVLVWGLLVVLRLASGGPSSFSTGGPLVVPVGVALSGPVVGLWVWYFRAPVRRWWCCCSWLGPGAGLPWFSVVCRPWWGSTSG